MEPLGPVGREVVRELVRRFGTSPETKRIAQQAGRLLKVAEQARALVATDGLVVRTDKGTFRHPAVEVERSMRASYLTAVRILESPRRGKVGKPPMGEALTAGDEDKPGRVVSRFFPRARRAAS
jgi:hypothetical protein